MNNRNKNRRGNAILEFALASTVLIPAMLCTFQLGYSFYAYNKLQQAVDNAARFASFQTYAAASSTPSEAFTTSVRNFAVYGNASAVDKPVTPGLQPANIRVTATMNGATPEMVTVAVNTFTFDAVIKKFTLTGKPAASYPFRGRTAPSGL
jgi:Flp pilus assembly protein TadG